MRISDAIEKLKKIQQESESLGDIDVVVLTDDGDGQFLIDRDYRFDLVELPDQNGDFKGAMVCAFMAPVHPDQIQYPKLSLVKG